MVFVLSLLLRLTSLLTELLGQSILEKDLSSMCCRGSEREKRERQRVNIPKGELTTQSFSYEDQLCTDGIISLSNKSELHKGGRFSDVHYNVSLRLKRQQKLY